MDTLSLIIFVYLIHEGGFCDDPQFADKEAGVHLVAGGLGSSYQALGEMLVLMPVLGRSASRRGKGKGSCR